MSSLAVPRSDTLPSQSFPAGPSPTPTFLSPTPTICGDADANTKTGMSPTSTPDKAESLAPSKVIISQRKKWLLLAVFSLAFFIDIWSYSAFFIFTGPISADLSVVFEQQSWVITSYAVTFSAFLLFWGRVADLFSAKSVFSYGFIGLGIFNLIISFLPDKYSFFVFRALSGISGAALIPAAFRLIVAVFEPEELGKAFTIYGMSGAIANTTGIIVAGFVEYIPNKGQMVAWRWFFRILSAVIVSFSLPAKYVSLADDQLPFAIGSLWWVPKPAVKSAPVTHVWRRLDLVGSLSMLLAIVLLILGLTLGASDGWVTPQFLVPFLLAFVLLPFFFLWESRIPTEYALLPPATWRIPNFAVLIIFALYIYSWWSLNFLPLIETFVQVHNNIAIIAAVRMLPQGISAAAVTIFLTVYPQFVSKPRWPIAGGMIAGMVGYVLFILSEGQTDDRYWKFIFTGGIIGSGGTMVVFTATNVGIMTSVPPEMAGVAGAVLQVALQVGAAVALSIQAGLLTIQPGNLTNWVNVRTSFIFVIGWGVVWLVGFLIFYKPGKTVNGEDEAEQGERVIVHM